MLKVSNYCDGIGPSEISPYYPSRPRIFHLPGKIDGHDAQHVSLLGRGWGGGGSGKQCEKNRRTLLLLSVRVGGLRQ